MPRRYCGDVTLTLFEIFKLLRGIKRKRAHSHVQSTPFPSQDHLARMAEGERKEHREQAYVNLLPGLTVYSSGKTVERANSG